MDPKLIASLLGTAVTAFTGIMQWSSSSDSAEKQHELEKLKLQLDHSKNKNTLNAGIITAAVGGIATIAGAIITKKLSKNN